MDNRSLTVTSADVTGPLSSTISITVTGISGLDDQKKLESTTLTLLTSLLEACSRRESGITTSSDCEPAQD